MTPRRATIGSGAGPRRKSDFTNFCVHALSWPELVYRCARAAACWLPAGKDFEWIVERDG